jgi:hypothetical protein
LIIDDVGSEVKLQPTCVYDLRWIATTGKEYYLSEITPNPVSGSVIELRFGVAFDGWTEIAIVNTSGEVVRRVATGEMKAGDYTVRVDVSNLTSGMYFVTMHSQSYREKKQFVLTK